MSPQQWEIRSIKFVKSRVLERLSFFELLLILFDKGKICEKVFFLTNDVSGDYFFSRASRGRLQGRESFHVLVSTEPCCVNTPAADDRQQNRCRRPSGCVCLLYDLCFHMICIYG